MNKQKQLRHAEIRRVLVLQFSPIGDTIFAVPALKALREYYPQATIVVLASARAGDVLKGLPYHDMLRICRSGLDVARTLVEFRHLHFDLAVGLSNQGSWLSFFCGTPFKAGFPTPLLSLAEPGALKEEPAAHVVEYCLAVVRLLGATVPGDRRLELWLSPAEKERARTFLAAHGLSDPMVAVHPGGRYFPLKRWPVERFARLVDALAGQGYRAVIVGGPEDTELAGSLAEQAECEPVVAAGRLRLKETAALLAHCRLFIGNDSAPLHMAAAVNTPTLGLFGPTDPRQFSPYGPGHTVLYKALPCSPCFRFLGGLGQYLPKCTRAQCMEAITVEETAAAALNRLGRGEQAPALGEGRG